MGSNFVPVDRAQQYLFPPPIQDWLPENHLARFIVDIVSQLDLRPLVETYAGKRVKAHHPQVLLSFLFYGSDELCNRYNLLKITLQSMGTLWYSTLPLNKRLICKLVIIIVLKNFGAACCRFLDQTFSGDELQAISQQSPLILRIKILSNNFLVQRC